MNNLKGLFYGLVWGLAFGGAIMMLGTLVIGIYAAVLLYIAVPLGFFIGIWRWSRWQMNPSLPKPSLKSAWYVIGAAVLLWLGMAAISLYRSATYDSDLSVAALPSHE